MPAIHESQPCSDVKLSLYLCPFAKLGSDVGPWMQEGRSSCMDQAPEAQVAERRSGAQEAQAGSC